MARQPLHGGDAVLPLKPLPPGPILALLICAALLNACAAPAPRDTSRAEREVADTERAFAKTMADRDYLAFKSFLSDDAIFFSGTRRRFAASNGSPTRGSVFTKSPRRRSRGSPSRCRCSNQASLP